MVRYTKLIPMAIRTCSKLITMITGCGSTAIGRSLTTGGIPTISLFSVSESAFFTAAFIRLRFFLIIIEIFLPAAKHFTNFLKF